MSTVDSVPLRSRAARFAGMIAAMIFLTGCIDYDEEMWLNSDLSGRVAMLVSVPEKLVKGSTGLEKDFSEDTIRRDIERVPGVKLDSYQSFRDAGKVQLKLRISFDSLEKLTRHESGVADSNAVTFLGSITVLKHGGKIQLERTLRALPETKSQNTGQDLLVKGLGGLFLSNNYLTYKLHVPAEIITANTARIDGPNRTLEWKYTLAQAMREPPVMTVTWKNSHPAMWIAAALFAVSAAGFGWGKWRRK